jgi:long-chain acyl-CoA synthetase
MDAALVAEMLPGRWLKLVDSHGNKPAFRKKSRGVWRTLTWGQWHAHVCELVQRWQQRGVRRGSSVLVVLGNRFEWPIIDMAAQVMGVAVVGIHPSSAVDEAGTALVQSAASLAVFQSTTDLERLYPGGLPPSVSSFVLESQTDRERPINCKLLDLDLNLDLDLSRRTAEPRARAVVEALIDEVTGTEVAAQEWDTLSNSLRSCSQAELANHASVSATRDGKWTLAIVSSARLTERIRQWRTLCEGGTVHFPESPETIPNDLREVMPDAVCAPSAFWESQRSELMKGLSDAPRLAQILFEFASSSPNPGTFRRLLLRNVRSHMGIAKGQVLFDGPGPVKQDLLDWYGSIGAAVSAVPCAAIRDALGDRLIFQR